MAKLLTEVQRAAKCEREKQRRSKFTTAQKAVAALHSRQYTQYRRLTDADYRDRVRRSVRQLYWKHRDARVAAMAEKNRRTRQRCIEAYGGGCWCCGETESRFLTIDHIVSRRESVGTRVGGKRMGQALYSWIIRNDFPAGLRVLCYNCNCARGADGVCPHEIARDAQEKGA